MNFKNYLEISASEINQELEYFLEDWNKKVNKVSSRLNLLDQSFIEANQGGSRLRGCLVKLGYELAKNNPNPEILKPAIAYEIFQTSILAHDDIIDRSDLRRNKPALWKALGGNHYGISQAVCLGDIGFFLAQKLIVESNFPEKTKNKALLSFINTVLDTAIGEILDVELPSLKCAKTEKDVLTIFRLKTAHYTIVGPLHLGVILGGGSEKLLNFITKFGEDLGIAFQIQDDILGIYGDEKVTGKSITSDAEEGKITLMILYALKHSIPKQKRVLENFYGNGQINLQKLEQIREVFIKTGALAYSQDKAFQLVSEAKSVITGMGVSLDHQNLLCQMADFLVKREK